MLNLTVLSKVLEFIGIIINNFLLPFNCLSICNKVVFLYFMSYILLKSFPLGIFHFNYFSCLFFMGMRSHGPFFSIYFYVNVIDFYQCLSSLFFCGERWLGYTQWCSRTKYLLDNIFIYKKFTHLLYFIIPLKWEYSFPPLRSYLFDIFNSNENAYSNKNACMFVFFLFGECTK